MLLLTGLSLSVALASTDLSCTSALVTEWSRPTTDRQRAIYAQALAYARGRDPQAASRLLALGAPAEAARGLIARLVGEDLAELESLAASSRLARGSSDAGPGLETFARAFDLNPTRGLVGRLQPEREVRWRESARRALHSAALAGDPSLTRRALAQGLRHGLVNELIAVAAAGGHSAALLDLGRLCLSRYLFFDRNDNWLADALRAFAEVTGPARGYVEGLLFELHDLLRSPAILANEGAVRTYAPLKQMAEYHLPAARALVAALPVDRRRRRDSTAGFHYLHGRTTDPRFAARLERFVRDLMNERRSLAVLAPAVIQLAEPRRLVRLAGAAERYAKEPPPELNAREAEFFRRGAEIFARNAFAASGDVSRNLAYLRRALADRRVPAAARALGFETGPESLLVPPPTLALWRRVLDVPTLISSDVTGADLYVLGEWVRGYEYHRGSDNAEPARVLNPPANFHHHEGCLRTWLKGRDGASPADLARTGEERFANDDLWSALAAFSGARDLGALERVYARLLERGREDQAVYAALAMECVRAGTDEIKKGLPRGRPFPNLESEVQPN